MPIRLICGYICCVYVTMVRPAVNEDHLDSIGERIRWSFRSWCWGYPVSNPRSRILNQWQLTDPDDVELYGKEVRTIQHAWKFLEPFFTSRGYACMKPTTCHIYSPAAPVPHGTRAPVEPSYPFHITSVKVSFGSVYHYSITRYTEPHPANSKSLERFKNWEGTVDS